MVRVSTNKKSKLPESSIYTGYRLKLLSDVTSAIASKVSLPETLDSIVTLIYNYFKPRGASIMVVDGDEIRVVAGRSVSQQPGKPEDLPKFKVGEGVAGRVAVTGKPEWINDTIDDPRWHNIPGKVSKIRSVMAVPMVVKGRVTGVLNVTYSEPHEFTEEEVAILQVIAVPSAYAIQNASLFEKIKDERQKLELVQSSMRDGMTIGKLDGTLTYINKAAKELLGLSDEAIGRSALYIATHLSKFTQYQIDYEFSIPQMLASVGGGKPFKAKLIVRSEPVRYIESVYFPLRNAENKISGIIGIYRDVSELEEKSQKLENQLRNTESEKNRWQAIFDNVEESIVITDKDGKVLQANPATEIISGLDLTGVIGHDFSKVFPLKNSQGVPLTDDFSPGKTVLTTKEPIEYLEAKVENPDGREVWLGLSVTPTHLEDGNQKNDQVVFIIRDISRIKEIDQAKSDFVSMASHELRTPLTVINGYLSLFLSGDLGNIDDPNLAHYKKVFTQIQKSTERLNKLVEDLLNVSRIEQGRLQLTLEKMNLSLLIEDVVGEMKEHAASRGHKLKYNPPTVTFLELPLLIKGDHSKIKQVLINLIDNAIKYTKEGGLIEISLKRDRQEAIVSVKDNGLGIPKNLLPRIFEKFQRLEGSYVKDTVGTGLGLYIVKEILKAHGGRIWINSQVGKGSTFSFSLPLYRD